jgi:DNA modification methylase
MARPKQIPLLENLETPKSTSEAAEWGTFKDSLRAPVHSWFTYPAGFSYRAVERSIEIAKLIPGKSIIYDPFMGSGTTNIVAKSLGISSFGVEAHPFVYEITQTKMHWTIEDKTVLEFLARIPTIVGSIPQQSTLDSINRAVFPELIIKCFLPEALYSLYRIREGISQSSLPPETARFLRTALICTLRDVSIAATGWPYIAPKKIKVTSMSKNAEATYAKRVSKMLEDLRKIRDASVQAISEHQLVLGSSADSGLPSNSAHHIFTSPPYLNNFDYADRTRLEMYFMGEATDWGDISNKVRTRLMTSATTQISRLDERYDLSMAIQKAAPEVYAFLTEARHKLGKLRMEKGGKKSYDLLISGYFNDIFKILEDNFRVLRAGSEARYILGDSAPYGVHIPTDELIGKIGVALGFSSYKVQVLRERGGKWANNPQRHSVPLRETIVTLRK